MRKVTREHYDRLRQDVPKKGNRCPCPVWTHSQSHLILANSDPAGPKNCLSPRAGGVFRFHDSAGSAITDEETRKRVSSWIWEQNAAFEKLGKEEEAELPELTPSVIREVARRPSLTAEQRIDRAVQAIGRPSASLLVPQQYGPQTGDDPAEISGLLREIERKGLIRNQHPSGNTPNYMLSSDGLRRLETGAG